MKRSALPFVCGRGCAAVPRQRRRPRPEVAGDGVGLRVASARRARARHGGRTRRAPARGRRRSWGRARRAGRRHRRSGCGRRRRHAGSRGRGCAGSRRSGRARGVRRPRGCGPASSRDAAGRRGRGARAQLAPAHAVQARGVRPKRLSTASRAKRPGDAVRPELRRTGRCAALLRRGLEPEQSCGPGARPRPPPVAAPPLGGRTRNPEAPRNLRLRPAGLDLQNQLQPGGRSRVRMCHERLLSCYWCVRHIHTQQQAEPLTCNNLRGNYS